jgi:hypothetical protein
MDSGSSAGMTVKIKTTIQTLFYRGGKNIEEASMRGCELAKKITE